MRKLSIIIALALLISIGGVYATWTYTDLSKVDVADESVNLNMNLTNVTFGDTYGTFEIVYNNLSLYIDPKVGTDHKTALYGTGEIQVKFTPSGHAPSHIKSEGLDGATYQFSLRDPSVSFNDGSGSKPILSVNPGHADTHTISDWGEPVNGVFTFSIQAEDIIEHFILPEFDLDTKADYDAFNSTLPDVDIIFAVSDGIYNNSSQQGNT